MFPYFRKPLFICIIVTVVVNAIIIVIIIAVIVIIVVFIIIQLLLDLFLMASFANTAAFCKLCPLFLFSLHCDRQATSKLMDENNHTAV